MKPVFVLGGAVVLLWTVSSVVLCARDPYIRIEAESMDVNNGVTVTTDSGTSGSKYVSALQPGDHIGYSQVNFSVETAAFEWQMKNAQSFNLQSQVLLRLDAPTSAPFLTFHVEYTAGLWVAPTTLIPVEQRPRGVHDLYFTFQHPTATTDLVHFDWFRFVILESLLPRSHTLCPVLTKAVMTSSAPAHCDAGHPTAQHCHGSAADGGHKQVVINIY